MSQRENCRTFIDGIFASAAEIQNRCNAMLVQLDDAVPEQQPTETAAAGTTEAEAGNLADPSLINTAMALFNARRAVMAKPPAKLLFHDPAWDILLDLYIARSMNKKVSVTSVSLSTNAPQTTALRYLWHLESEHFIKREMDITDKRRNFVNLTEIGLQFVEDIISIYAKNMANIFGQAVSFAS